MPITNVVEYLVIVKTFLYAINGYNQLGRDANLRFGVVRFGVQKERYSLLLQPLDKLLLNLEPLSLQ